MRPTRWTMKKRSTKFGKGGWHISFGLIQYTNPVTGNGVACDRPFKRILQMRKAQEEKLVTPEVEGVTWEP